MGKINARSARVAVVMALMLLVALSGSVFAVDYSSQIQTFGEDLVTDAAPNLAAAFVVGLALIGVFTGLTIAFKGIKKARSQS